MEKKKNAAPKIGHITPLHSLDDSEGHGTSHHHKGDGFLTLNAFIENVIFCVVHYYMERKVSLHAQRIFLLKAMARLGGASPVKTPS
jgi:hypothetical protein